MANTDSVEISLVEEVSEGVLPTSSTVTTPIMQMLNKISVNASHGRQFAESPESRGDRKEIESDLTGSDPTYQMQALFRPKLFDGVIASALRSDWVEQPFRRNRYNLNLAEVNANAAAPTKQITAVTASSSTFTVTTGAVFPQKSLVRAQNFGVAANNGIFVSGSGSGAAAFVADGATLADETPPVGAELKMIGVQGAAGEIIATSTGLTWTGMDWANYGVVPYMWIVVGGPLTGNRFAGHDVAGKPKIMRCRVAAGGVSGATLTFDRKPANWAADTGSGKQIRVYIFDRIKIGSAPKTFTIQVKKNRRRVAAAIERFSGLHASAVSLQSAARDRLQIDAGLRGPLYDHAATNLNTGALAMPPLRSFLSKRFGNIYADGTEQRIPVSTGTVILNPSLLPAEEWGFEAYGDYDAATQMTHFNGELQFETDYARDKFHGEAFGDILLPWERDGYDYLSEFSRFQFTAISEAVSGKGSLIKQSFEGKGVANDDGALNDQFVMWRGFIEKRAA